MRNSGKALRRHQGGIHHAGILVTNASANTANILETVTKKHTHSTKDMRRAEKTNVTKRMPAHITRLDNAAQKRENKNQRGSLIY